MGMYVIHTRNAAEKDFEAYKNGRYDCVFVNHFFEFHAVAIGLRTYIRKAEVRVAGNGAAYIIPR